MSKSFPEWKIQSGNTGGVGIAFHFVQDRISWRCITELWINSQITCLYPYISRRWFCGDLLKNICYNPVGGLGPSLSYGYARRTDVETWFSWWSNQMMASEEKESTGVPSHSAKRVGFSYHIVLLLSRWICLMHSVNHIFDRCLDLRRIEMHDIVTGSD